MQILKLCRSCMKEVASWELENFDVNAVSMFTFCTNVEITDDDKLPKQFCYDCTIQIESSHTFIRKAQEVNVTLKNLISRAETSVIVKSENFINNFDGSNSLQSELDFNSEGKINKVEENTFSSNCRQDDGINGEQDMCTPIVNEINESIDIKDFLLPEMTLLNVTNTDDFDSNSREISNEDGCYLQSEGQTEPKNALSTNTGNEQNKTKKIEDSKEFTRANKITKKIYNTDDFDSDSREISNEDGCYLQSEGQTEPNNALLTNTGKEQNETKKIEDSKEFTRANKITKKLYNTRSKIQQSHEVNNKEKGDEKQNVNKDTILKCHICKNKTFKYESKLQKHMKTKHSKCTEKKDRGNPKLREEKGDNTNPDLKTCDICERTFTSALWFSRHIENEHSDSVKQYSCPYCTKTFLSYHTWRYHRDQHDESRRFACAVCDARFRRRKQLAAHARAHDPARPHVCTSCGMAFKVKSILTSHMKVHLDEKPFLCSVCGFSTKLLNTLKDHMLTHTGEKPHTCNECSFRTASVTSLRRHKLRHRGEKRHACQHCGKKFYEPGTLTRHMRIHTGERPFQCYLCSEAFSDGWTCKLHLMRRHRIPLEDIPRLSKIRHVRIHTGERPFQCYLCNEAFSDGWKCKSHLMRRHRIPLENIPRLSKVKPVVAR